MAEGINVRLPAQLKAFVEEKASPDGLYGSASEYIRDLVRHDYEKSDAEKEAWLNGVLDQALAQPLETYKELDMNEFIQRKRKAVS